MPPFHHHHRSSSTIFHFKISSKRPSSFKTVKWSGRPNFPKQSWSFSHFRPHSHGRSEQNEKNAQKSRTIFLSAGNRGTSLNSVFLYSVVTLSVCQRCNCSVWLILKSKLNLFTMRWCHRSGTLDNESESQPEGHGLKSRSLNAWKFVLSTKCLVYAFVFISLFPKKSNLFP